MMKGNNEKIKGSKEKDIYIAKKVIYGRIKPKCSFRGLAYLIERKRPFFLIGVDLLCNLHHRVCLNVA